MHTISTRGHKDTILFKVNDNCPFNLPFYTDLLRLQNKQQSFDCIRGYKGDSFDQPYIHIGYTVLQDTLYLI